MKGGDMPNGKKHSYAEINAYLKTLPPLVPEKYINDKPFLSGLSCDEFLFIISLAEFSNIELATYWKYHDENCDCELNMKSIEPLS